MTERREEMRDELTRHSGKLAARILQAVPGALPALFARWDSIFVCRVCDGDIYTAYHPKCDEHYSRGHAFDCPYDEPHRCPWSD